jgi:Fe-S-cluster containining protein
MFAAYASLLEQIEGRLARIPRCACPPECDRCCRVSFTVFPVEAFHMRSAFLRLPRATAVLVRQRATAAPESACPFLGDRRCAVYASRPVLCQLHGHPFVHRKEGEDRVAVYPGCEELSLESLPSSADGIRRVSALDLEGINVLLAAANNLFLQEPEYRTVRGRDRIPVTEIPGRWFPRGETDADL